MAETLLVRLPPAESDPPMWVTTDARGALIGTPQSGALELAAPLAAGRRVCVLVPGPEVLLTSADVPLKAGAKLAQLVPFALEEQLAEDIDTLHFATGRRPEDSSHVPVAVVARTLMDGWLARLRAAGIEPHAMHADSDLLPQNPGQATALLESDAVIVRPAGGTPVSLPADALLEALQLAHSAPGAEPTTFTAVVAPAPLESVAGRGLILYTGAAEWQRHAPLVEGSRQQFDGVRIQLLPTGPLALFAQQLAVADPIDLLQGPYAPVRASTVGWRAWRTAAVLLAALLGLHIVGKATELSLLKHNERKVDTQLRETLRSTLPGESVTPDLRRRLEQRLASARGEASGGLLPALGALARASGAAPGTTLQSMNFHNGTLELKVSAPDAASLDRIAQNLKGSGWPAELTGGNAAGARYEGRIQMRAP